MSSALAVGMTFPSLDAPKDALLRHTVACSESYIIHKRAVNCFITKCRSKTAHIAYGLLLRRWIRLSLSILNIRALLKLTITGDLLNLCNILHQMQITQQHLILIALSSQAISAMPNFRMEIGLASRSCFLERSSWHSQPAGTDSSEWRVYVD
jgi:hypothetical protein